MNTYQTEKLQQNSKKETLVSAKRRREKNHGLVPVPHKEATIEGSETTKHHRHTPIGKRTSLQTTQRRNIVPHVHVLEGRDDIETDNRTNALPQHTGTKQHALLYAKVVARRAKIEKERQARDNNHITTLQAIQIFDCLLQTHQQLKEFVGNKRDTTVNNDGRTCIGQYELIGRLGKGGYGEVWQARYSDTSSLATQTENFAIKIMSKAKYASKHMMDLLAEEINLLKIVNHKNIVSAKDVLHGEGYVYIVMDLALMDLTGYKKKYGDWESFQKCVPTILKGVIEGVAYLHENGIAHMDLKSDNVLIHQDVSPANLTTDNIRICDLGLCVVADSTGKVTNNTARGTYGLMAPEVYMASTWETTYEAKRADIWSVGVIVMDLMGCSPSSWMTMFDKNNRHNFDRLLLKTMNILYIKLEIMDPTFSDLLVQMMNVSPSERMTVHDVMNHGWLSEPTRCSFLNVFRNLFCGDK